MARGYHISFDLTIAVSSAQGEREITQDVITKILQDGITKHGLTDWSCIDENTVRNITIAATRPYPRRKTHERNTKTSL